MTPEGKFEIGDVATIAGGSFAIVIAIDETAAGVQILRVQRTDRETMIAPTPSASFIEWTRTFDEKTRNDIRDGKPGW